MSRSRRGRKSSTLRDYRSAIKSTLLPEFGTDTPLEELSEERLSAFRAALLTDGKLARRTVQKHVVLLNGILKRARACKWISRNLMDDVEPVSIGSSGEFNVLSAVQVEAVARKADDVFAPAIIVAAYTGLRTGELRALRWRDVDFAGQSLRVSRNMPAGGDEGSPKSGKVRSTPLVDDAARELDGLSRRPSFTGADDVVFCTEVGGMLPEDSLRKALYAALADAGIDRKSFPAHGGFTFHDLRHTFGTMAAQVWPLHDVQAFMGHADIQTTMKYAHHVPKNDAASRLTEFVRQQKAGNDSGTISSPSPHRRPISRDFECRGRDSNPRHADYDSAALTD